jgi:hypothetical protein
LSREQRGDGESKGYREADIAHVQHRRVNDQPGILQQRVQIAPLFGARQQSLEGVRGHQDEQQEAGADQTEHAQHPRDHVHGELLRAHGNRQRPQCQHHYPQQQRAFVSAPDRSDAVFERQQRVRMLRHIKHRKVIVDEGHDQAGEGHRQQQRLRHRRRTGERHPGLPATVGAEQRQGTLYQGDDERDDEREVAEFRDHGRVVRVTV